MVNIKDIAKEAKVSVATVSHVINENYFVSDELIKRVREVISKLNYSPNLIAGSLRRKKTGTIGLIIPDISNPFFSELAKCIEDATYLLGYNIFICNSSYDIKRELNNLDMLISKRVDGILMLPEINENSFIKKAKDSGIPVVLIERKLPDIDIVLIDHFKAGYESTKYLINLGHRNIAFIDRRSDKYHSVERRRGYIKALKEHKIEIESDLIIRGGLLCISGFEIVRTILKRKIKVTALLCFEDFEAIGAISAVKKSGLEVPKDLSIIGYGDLSFSEYIFPELTTIRIDISQLAIEAIRILKLRIRNLNVKKPITRLISPELIIRKSTSKAPK